MTPADSDDLTGIVKEEQGSFLVLRSPKYAEHEPCYIEIDRFLSLEAASTYLLALQRSGRI